jgi:hypothetical protein
MAQKFYLKKFQTLYRDAHFLYNRAVEKQASCSILEQIECLGENILANIEEIKKHNTGRQRWPLLEENYEDLKLDLFFNVKLLNNIGCYIKKWSLLTTE